MNNYPTKKLGEIVMQGLKLLLQSFFKHKSHSNKQTPQSKVPPSLDFSTTEKKLDTEPKEEVVKKEEEAKKWYVPIRADKFSPYEENEFLKYDPETYPTTKHHPGIDYRTHSTNDVSLHFCADGEIIESGFLPKSLGNYFCFYVPEVDHTFIYCHLCDTPPPKGKYNVGVQAGIAGTTGKSTGIHLHLECIKGRHTFASRMQIYTSETNLLQAAKDGTIKNADAFIRSNL